MKTKIVLSMCICFLTAFTVISVLPISGEEQIYNNMIRLHVIANSDTKEDQELKLKVRDAVLESVDSLELSDGKLKAEADILKNMNLIQKTAENVIYENGYNYDVNIKLGYEKYPEREYDGFVLPKGKYTSLRIIIGSGEGHNWWCVLYPPLCKTTAEKREEVFISAGFTGEQYKIITERGKTKYKIKFKMLELFQEMFETK